MGNMHARSGPAAGSRLRKSVHFIALLAALAIFGAMADGKPESRPIGIDGRHNVSTRPHVLRVVMPQDFVTLNPHLYAATSLSMVSQLSMAYLVRYDHRGSPVPELLRELPSRENGGISWDGKTLTLRLRDRVRWSDGWPFDASDVVFSFNTVRNPANAEISREGFNRIADVRALDQATVVVRLREPYADIFPTFFGSAGANPCILPRHILGRLPNINDAFYNGLPVGIGPFRYARWRRGEVVVLESNPFYFRGRPKLQRVEFRTISSEATALTQMRTGEADLWTLVRPGLYPQAKEIRTAVTRVIPGSYFSHIDFNLERRIVSDRRVRQALRAATDREAVRRDIRQNTGLLQEGYAAPGSLGYDASIPFVRYDPQAASRLLDQAGWRMHSDGIRYKDGRPLRFEFAVAMDPDTDRMVEFLRGMWRKVGIDLDVRRYAATLFFESRARGGILAAGRFDIAQFSWQSDVLGDVSDLYTCNARPPDGQNYLRYCDRRTDALFAALKIEYDYNRKRVLLGKIQRRLIDDVPTIVLGINDDIYTANSDLHNFHPSAFSPFDDMMDVDI